MTKLSRESGIKGESAATDTHFTSFSLGRTRLESEHLAGLYELGRSFAFRRGGEIYCAKADEEVVEDRH